MSAAITATATSRICAACGNEFEDRSRTAPRSYCYVCSPIGGKRALTSAPTLVPLDLPGEPNTVEHFEAWAAELTLDTGAPWIVEEFFLAYLDDLFAGFPECWLLVPEGNTKTTSMSGLALYHCEFTSYGWVPWAASSRDQAEIGYIQASGLIERNPRLDALFTCHRGLRRIVCQSTRARVQIFSAEERTGDGVIPTLPMLDELHRHRDLRLYRTWRGKLSKRGGQLAAFSTAGEPGGEFEVTREQIKATATELHVDGSFTRAVSGTVVLHEWAVPADADVDDLAVVKAANPFSGITGDVLEEKKSSPSMTPSHWRRFTCNQAVVTDQDPYLSALEWDVLADGDPIPDGAAVCLGADGSRSFDTTVVAWSSLPDAGGRLDVDAHVFSVREEAAHHTLHKGGKIDFDDVEAFILDQFSLFSVREVAYDPRYLERSMEIADRRLPDAKIAAVEPTSKHMRDALQVFYSMVLEGKIRHRGDPVIAAHIANTRAWRGESGEIRRVAKMDPRLPIDAVPALALAVWRASRLGVPREYALAWV
jgi:phage terminase large subunit-like protein